LLVANKERKDHALKSRESKRILLQVKGICEYSVHEEEFYYRMQGSPSGDIRDKTQGKSLMPVRVEFSRPKRESKRERTGGRRGKPIFHLLFPSSGRRGGRHPWGLIGIRLSSPLPGKVVSVSWGPYDPGAIWRKRTGCGED